MYDIAEHAPEETRVARRPPRALTFVLALFAGLALMQGAAAADGQDDQMIALINQARAQKGLPALQADPALAGVAQDWSNTMAAKDQLYHRPDLASQVGARVTTQWTRIGENVGVGGDIPGLHNAFMASSGHYANIMGDYNRIGVGHTFANGRLWVTVNFLKGPALSAPPQARSFAPFRDAGQLVGQQYTDFLGRSADPSGSSYWVYMLNAGASTPPAMIESMLNSPEFQGAVAPVARLYFAYFNRMPDYAGLVYWQGRLRTGSSIFDVSNAFAQSSEFTTKYGNISNTDFVKRVYLNVLGRDGDMGGLLYWIDKLDKGVVTRGQTMVNFSESPEYKGKKRAEVNVLMVYVGMLRRIPDASGYAYWVGQVRSGRSVQDLIAAFYGSPEYAKRVN